MLLLEVATTPPAIPSTPSDGPSRLDAIPSAIRCFTGVWSVWSDEVAGPTVHSFAYVYSL